MSEQDAIRDAVAKQESLLAELERRQSEARNRLDALKIQLHSANAVPESQVAAPPCTQAPAPMTPAEKVALFRRLFRGRDDVFPKLWVNAKNGKKGYAPACSNEWVRGICEKPKVKCGECPNQAFIPVADQVIVDHLQGRHVIGVYPLLKDETCWFLAADFDKASWQDDVAAFIETCRSVGIQAAVERSRSGNGAHVWFFFASPLPAKTARQMGCTLITETMARRHELSMDSYDRLFPNQDTMPRGGFGNLIALPLQHEPRLHENTVFVDNRFRAFREQWAYLASLSRIDPTAVEAIANEAVRHGRVIGVGLSDLDDEEAAAPWKRAPSGRSKKIRIADPLPSEVRAVLAQRVFVEKAGLPSPLVNEIKRLAAFQSPEFYKKQAMRLSTALTPRVVTCAEDLPQHVAVPRGCLDDLRGLLADHGVALRVDDQRQDGEGLELEFKGQLTAIQEQAAQSLLHDDIGVFVAPPGVGKTVVGAYLVAARRRSTLILVHRKPLLD
ncbi:MAG: restriction endonuclease subunit R, partial [Planctomycetes bacterium]|nr:restriction endonuclease subunit R [Planctomycetota bacterium]